MSNFKAYFRFYALKIEKYVRFESFDDEGIFFVAVEKA